MKCSLQVLCYSGGTRASTSRPFQPLRSRYSRPMIPTWARWGLVILAFAATGLIAYFVLDVATSTHPNQTAAGLLQVMTLSIGLVASFVSGRFSAQRAATDVIRPHARSAFRRSLGIFNSFNRTITSLDDTDAQLAEQRDEDGRVDFRLVRYALRAIRLQVTEQVGIAGDAMEDWRDVVPEEIERVETRLRDAHATPPNPPQTGEQ